ncbi:MAG: nucleotidyltransferase family protein [Sphingomonadales bacterium]|nr:nucleotidyltransferase family protein [Sphingomonadales bacterium]NCO99820.1 nucleotidyltransferase family protein [Sphingomonadales bacterium]NCP28128.1 nucleotidyltransferase family protein [Sphingomonadales bacterium]NCP42360.1 nucleotidyltransferase family protein [Sphingomonadales bacterium]NCP48930.1 nucleotidyltransferase family protein [Sphingomonadales bacterium]
MTKNSGILLALLAAGQSRRFGERDKLSALLGGKMLGLHAAEVGAAMPFAHKLVIGSPEHRCAAQWRDLGYQILANDDAAQGQATSVRLAAAHAIKCGASGLCILLADMPFVTRDHLGQLLAAFAQSGGTVASSRDGRAMPPTIFPIDKLEPLTTLQGDTGARRLLSDAHLIAGDDDLLFDIDTAEDLARANEKTARPG